ncbi:hypothetical protein PUN71_015605 [Arthrobacter sp. NQ7]|nr:hypothetical protein [Arthrobacter sp. NQ7]MDJ0458630.1 hypothetical protein [Arthrobacter sp. NQ7]
MGDQLVKPLLGLHTALTTQAAEGFRNLIDEVEGRLNEPLPLPAA